MNTQPSKIQVIKPSLPQGGGTIKGMGEEFAPHEFSGSSGLSIPLPVTACRGMESSLHLNYSSGNANSPYGYGWDLSLAHISRQTTKGTPRYLDVFDRNIGGERMDTFLLSGSDYLVKDLSWQPTSMTTDGDEYQVQRYLPRLEGDFSLIDYYVNKQDASDQFWKVHSANNVVTIFGKSKDARVYEPSDLSKIFKWLPQEVYDDKGNHRVYTYRKDGNQAYIDTVLYGNAKPITDGSILLKTSQTTLYNIKWHFKQQFLYGESKDTPTPIRKDSFSTFEAGFEIRTQWLLRSVSLYHLFDELGSESVLTAQLLLAHNEEDSQFQSYITEAKHVGWDFNKKDNSYTSKALPPLTFSYTSFDTKAQNTFEVLAEGADWDFELTDLYSEGIPGLLYTDGQSVLYKKAIHLSENGHAVTYDEIKSIPFPSGKTARGPLFTLSDVTGNGKMDLVVKEPSQAGYYQIGQDNQWTGFKAFDGFPSNFNNPHNQLEDITGDGLADLVLIDEAHVRYNASQRAQGYAAQSLTVRENEVTVSTPGSETKMIRFANFLGAGTAQRAEITNGQVKCWPGLGYGNFGAAKKLTFPIQEDFNTNRLFLCDIDGNGLSDIAYVSPDKMEIYRNESGNRFAEVPVTIIFPSHLTWSPVDKIQFADVLGNGTQCLVITKMLPTPALYYYDFHYDKSTNCTQKPHLLSKTINNMGAESEIQYRSSVWYYLQDAQNKTPWVTHLPFPVNVISQTKSHDLISKTTIISAYCYSHGYYDGVEREFRGFGYVGRTDSHSFEAFSAKALSTADAASYTQAPFMTKTWYHTGADLEATDLLEAYQKEYWRGDTGAYNMPGTAFEFLEGQENVLSEYGAYRSLHGTVLRSETYGNDNTPWSALPYSVSESQFKVIQLQAQATNKYSVFRTASLQSIHYDYERNADDPVIGHSFTLLTDNYGHVLESASVEYGRRKGQSTSEGQTKEQQEKTWVTYAKAEVLNPGEANGAYLLGIPVQQQQYELQNLKPASGNYFHLSDFINIKQAQEGLKSSLLSDLELLHWERDYYFDADNQTELALNQFAIPVLHHRTEQVVFDINLLKTQLPDISYTSLLTGDGSGTHQAKGGYITFDSAQDPASGLKPSVYYWNPGAFQQCGKADAFYLPKAFYDPFQYPHINKDTLADAPHNAYAYDPHWLMIKNVTDAMENQTVMSDFDYVQLHAKTMTDPNANWSKILTDPLGMVIATAHGGTQGEDTVSFDIDQYTEITNPSVKDILANPQKYLQHAATFFYYNLHSWKDNQIPVHSVHLNYSEYTSINGSDPQNQLIHKSISYSDGFGRGLQAKAWLNQKQEVRYLDGDVVATKTVDECWLTSGAVVYNDKGHPIRQYEPFYGDTYLYQDNEALNKVGYSSTLYYDAPGRAVLTQSADGFFTKTLHGELVTNQPRGVFQGYLNNQLYANLGQEKYDQNGQPLSSLDDLPVATEAASPYAFVPTAWSTLHYDANDCSDMVSSSALKGTDVDLPSLTKAQVFANTPHQSLTGSDGKVVETRQLNVPETEQDINYTTYDVYGNAVTRTDQRLYKVNAVNFDTTYNMGIPVKMVSADAGTSWSFADVAGHPFYHKDSRAFEQFSIYDSLLRPTEVIITGGTEQNAQTGDLTQLNLNNTVKRLVYVDTKGNKQLAAAQKANWIGKAILSFDESGLHLAPAYSIMGAAFCSRQWIKSDYKQEANWQEITHEDLTSLLSSLSAIQGRSALAEFDLPTAIGQLMLSDNFTTAATHNAIGQVLTSTDADGNTQTPAFDSLGRETSLSIVAGNNAQKADPNKKAPGTTAIAYNAKGQQTKELASNGVMTYHTYDPYNFRLTGIKSTRQEPGGSSVITLQDLIYHHDPAGNVTSQTNLAIPTVFFANQKVAPKADYTYDALYRLKKATGREQAGQWQNTQKNQGKADQAFYQKYIDQKNNGQALQNYVQYFSYDAGGNLLTQQGTGATRKNVIAQGSNRLTKTGVGDQLKDCSYDAHGNMLTLSGTAGITWNYRDNMASATQIERPDGTHDTEYYVYDGGGNRVRKISEQLGANGSTNIVEVLYAGGIEVRRSGTAQTPLPEGESDKAIIWNKIWHNVKLMSGRAVSCLWRYQIQGSETGATTSQQRFQLCDALDSCNYEVDHEGKVISYEEYYPYGGTSISLSKNGTEVKDKYYQYSSKEKDRTGLYYYGMRYYAPWLGRWTCTDPAGTVDGLNIYAFVEGNPVTSVDVGGMARTKKNKTGAQKKEAGGQPDKQKRAGFKQKKAQKSELKPVVMKMEVRQNKGARKKITQHRTILNLYKPRKKRKAEARNNTIPGISSQATINKFDELNIQEFFNQDIGTNLLEQSKENNTKGKSDKEKIAESYPKSKRLNLGSVSTNKVRSITPGRDIATQVFIKDSKNSRNEPKSASAPAYKDLISGLGNLSRVDKEKVIGVIRKAIIKKEELSNQDFNGLSDHTKEDALDFISIQVSELSRENKARAETLGLNEENMGKSYVSDALDSWSAGSFQTEYVGTAQLHPNAKFAGSGAAGYGAKAFSDYFQNLFNEQARQGIAA